MINCLSLRHCDALTVAALDGHTARRDFLTYALSLMRCHNDEHSDTLPTIDIAALRHIAYVLDALIYYMRSGTDQDGDIQQPGVGVGGDTASVHSWPDADDNDNDAEAATLAVECPVCKSVSDLALSLV